MSTRKRAPVITQPTLPSGMHALVWGKWPSADARLTVAGHAGVWAFKSGIEYGQHDRRVALVRWDEREQPMAQWRIAPVEWVRVEDEAV